MDEESRRIELECAHCGNQKLQQIPGTWTLLLTGEQGPVAGPTIPLVVIGCPTCGFVSFFSPQAVTPLPFPTESATPPPESR